MAIMKVTKRRGEVVDFSPEKITEAIRKAFLAVRGASLGDEKLKTLSATVLADLERFFANSTPSVENIQDVVEMTLMQDGYFDVAKSYILYRYEHSKTREDKKIEAIEKTEKEDLFVVKRSGEKERFSMAKLENTLRWATRGLEGAVDVGALAFQCRSELYDGVTTKEIEKSLMFAARSFIEQEPAYSHVASRLLLHKLYKEVVGRDVIDFKELERGYRDAFIAGIKKGVEVGKLDVRMLGFDLNALAAKLVIERDDILLYLGTQTLYDRYFLQDYERNVLETPQAFWMRVAMGLAITESSREEWVAKFYDALSTTRFVSSTPTLFHAGTSRPQLSSCYLNTVKDSLDHIFKVMGDNAQLSKWSGGIGTDWTYLRATGARIKGTGVESQGIIPFLKVANDTTNAINRSGRRRGAACVYLETWHYDIESFLELRKNTGDERRRTHDMDTSNWIPDLFMKRVREDGEWTLFSPEETPDLHDLFGNKFEQRYNEYEKMADEGKIRLFKRLKAKDLWKKMLVMLFETGHPWVTFKDPCNLRSPQDHVGVIHSSNLCTEITLNTSETETAVCNLGSVNLAVLIKDGKIDTAALKDTVETGMRMLDNVIDINFYPTKEASTSNLRHRPVGLGIMGFQDALYMLNINFDSEDCVRFADESMEIISFYAISASAKMAGERGAYETYKGSKWDRGIMPMDTLDILERERGVKIDVPRTSRMNWGEVRELVAKNGMRNSNCMAIAPTATISNIVGSLPCIEPIYKNIYVKSNVSGDFVIINRYLVEELKNLGLWGTEMLSKIKYHDGSIAGITEIPERLRAKYKEVFEIDPHWLLKSAAYRGKWVDQSQSLNLYFAGASGKALSELYMYAWEMGLKTTYYLRTLAASQVEKSTVSTAEFGSTHLRKKSEEEVVKMPGVVHQEVVQKVIITETIVSNPAPVPMSVLAGQGPGAASVYEFKNAVIEKPVPHVSQSSLPKEADPGCEACQ